MEHGIVTEDEFELLAQLREKIQDLNVPDELLEGKSLVRWLRARDHKIKDSEIMFRAHMKWRSEYNSETLKDFRLSPEWDDYFHCSLYTITEDGFPVFVIKISTWDFERGVKAGIKDDITRNGLAILERGWLTCVNNSKNRKYISQFLSIYDLSGLTWSHFSSHAALKIILDIVQGYEANYPECLGVGFMLNAPWIFQVIWKMLTPIMSAKTAAKIKFLGSNVDTWRTEISKVIPLEKFPQSFGGDGDNSTYMVSRL